MKRFEIEVMSAYSEAARLLGQRGGSRTSEAKTKAARENRKLGGGWPKGRPRTLKHVCAGCNTVFKLQFSHVENDHNCYLGACPQCGKKGREAVATRHTKAGDCVYGG